MKSVLWCQPENDVSEKTIDYQSTVSVNLIGMMLYVFMQEKMMQKDYLICGVHCRQNIIYSTV